MDEQKKTAGRPQIYTGEGMGREKRPLRRAEAENGEKTRQPRRTEMRNAEKGEQPRRTEMRNAEKGEQPRRTETESTEQVKRPYRTETESIEQAKQPHRTETESTEQVKRPHRTETESIEQAKWPRRTETERNGQAKQLRQTVSNTGAKKYTENARPIQRTEKRDGDGKPQRNAAVTKRRRDRESETRMRILWMALGVLIVLLVAAMIYEVVLGHGTKMSGAERMKQQKKQEEQVIMVNKQEEASADPDADGKKGNTEGQEKKDKKQEKGQTDGEEGQSEESSEPEGTDAPSVSKAGGTPQEQAALLAAQYDYDGAIKLLQNAEGYGENSELQAAVSRYEKQKAECVPYPAAEVTHIFFHTLIHDPAKAFDGDEYEAGYNQFMVTEGEFNSIIEQMYEKGYVMVYLSDMVSVTENADGTKTFAPKDIMLPPGKIPFVLSQDDVSYYHYMDGDGYASRLIVDENGDVKNEYIEDDGSVSVGDYDMVPLIDRFVEKHPDFSYKGAKGYVALTGYEGILGYRTDEVYKTKQADRVTVQQQMFFDSYPGGFDEAAFEKECEGAKKVADAMKANGWKFASHTWGHQNMHETNGIPWDAFKRDTDRWETWVEPLIGETDTMIYAFGGDIRGWEKYSGDRFDYLKQCGFDYYCGVDSAEYWVQIEPNYVRQSRRNVDGYRMFYNPEMLSDLFDVQKAWDPLRPSYVPEI